MLGGRYVADAGLAATTASVVTVLTMAASVSAALVFRLTVDPPPVSLAGLHTKIRLACRGESARLPARPILTT